MGCFLGPVSAKPVGLNPQKVRGFLEKHCITCHGPEKQKGKLRLDELSLELSNDSIAAHWQDVLDNLNAGDMPPEEEPQPGKAELTDASKEPLPVREMIELHQSKAQCASCHAKIDPIGYGLETFDAVGLWRDAAKVGKRMEKIEQGGTLPGGKAYNDFGQFKALLIQNKDKLARSLVEGIASYGLGRTVEFSDGDDLDTLTEGLISQDLRSRNLIHNLVTNTLFQTK